MDKAMTGPGGPTFGVLPLKVLWARLRIPVCSTWIPPPCTPIQSFHRQRGMQGRRRVTNPVGAARSEWGSV